MRVPVTPPQNNQSPNPKPISCTNNNNNNNNNRNIGFPHTNTNTNNNNPHPPPNSCYEPTSVLDLRRSPSPVREKPAATTTTEISALSDIPPPPPPPPIDWDEHVLRTMDWDSIMRDLGCLDDDSTPVSRIIPQFTPSSDQPQITHLPELTHQIFDPTQLVHPDINIALSDIYSNLNQINPFDISNNNSNNNFHSFSNLNFGFDFIEELIRAADCFDSNELQIAQVILARLNQRLRNPIGKPLQRAAFFFKEALLSLLGSAGSTRTTSRLSSWSDIVQNIKAYKAFSGLSPIPMFTHFTANQALLESLEGSPPFVHIIDFDIGLGGQYASFIREIAEKAEICKLNPPLIRITAVVPEEYAIETRLIKDNLTQFAQELKIRFQIEFVLIRTFEMLSFKAIKFMDGEKVAVILSPAIFRRYGSTNDVSRFLTDLRLVSPSVVVFVDSEGWSENGGTTTASSSFRRSFVNCLEFYSMMFESLDAAIGGGDWVRKIEMFLLRPRISAAIEAAAGRRVAPWRELFCGAGMRPVQLSQFADFQAECLLGKVQVRGFDVAKRQAELVLCWHERALVATSAWRF